MNDQEFDSASLDQVMKLAKQIVSRGLSQVELQPEDALVDVGFSSLDLANLMIAVEAEFDIMIPASHLTPANFRSVQSVARTVASVRPRPAETHA